MSLRLLASFAALLAGPPLALAKPPPTCPGPHWTVAAPPESGWDAEKLSRLDTLLQGLDTVALTVVHHGRIVFDYGSTTSTYNLHSARKSILSMLYGIAVGQGQAGLDATVGSLGIDDLGGLSDTEKTATVQQMLEARSCIDHEAEYETEAMKGKRPARHSCSPGSQWYYNNWDFNALGTAYRIQTGKTVFEGFSDELAGPLQLEDFNPLRDTRFVGGHSSRHPAYTIRLSSHDFARLGLLMARGGDWCGRQLLPAGWVSASTAPISPTDIAGVDYGYLWWTSARNIHFGHRFASPVFSARGHLGQYLLVVPADDLVVAHLSQGESDGHRLASSSHFGQVVKAVMDAMPR